MDDDLFFVDDDLEHDDDWRFFCHLDTRDSRPIFVKDELCELAETLLKQTVAAHDSVLWGYVILPDIVQIAVEVPTERTYHVLIEAYKDTCEQTITQAIQANHDDLLDNITYFNPAWPQPIHLIWQNGYQTQLLSSVYAMSNKVADIVQKPVISGLVDDPSQWHFSSYIPQHNTEDE